ncbi:MAG: bifunctional alpha,alpha-trehalose-phosphate synthase (UDP-forming)/trehalose-phosphatase [Polyangiaceae bacterium]
MKKAKLVVASARLPVTLTRRPDGWKATDSTGGLVTALSGVASRRRFTWIGWPGTVVSEQERGSVEQVLEQHGAAPVFMSRADVDGFYLGFSNRVLWPLFHGLTDKVSFDVAAFRAYQRVNDAFADKILSRVSATDSVWVHDYQLALVPELLRRKGFRGKIGFFLHIPFPSDETYRQLPPREALLRGLLGADFIGFHTYEYVSHFRATCLRVLGYETDASHVRLPSRQVELAALPIGIDPVEMRALSQSPEARKELATLRGAYGDKRLIVGVDRLDYTKGIPQKLLAFEALLAEYPQYRGRAVLIQVAAPSRTDVDEYQALKREVDELTGRINGRFGTPAYTPIVYVNQTVARSRLAGIYQASEVALITPLRDGMNLVALEYVLAREQCGGTLILSEFAGAAHCLPGARLVNPYNTQEIAAALAEALEQDAAQQGLGHMVRFIDDNTATAWARAFLDRLDAQPGAERRMSILLDLASNPVQRVVRRAKSPLVVLDYDGTLREYVMDPRDAVPSPRLLAVLEHLCRVARVWIISGRSRLTLEQWLGHLPLGLVCEHGLSMRAPGGSWERRVRVSGDTLKDLVRPLFEDFVRRTPGSRVEIKDAAIAWHYRAVDPEFAAFQVSGLLSRLEDLLKRRPFAVLHGNRVVEVRHRRVTKGQALQAVLKRHGNADALLVAGDDRTDEEMMDAIPRRWKGRSVTVWVGSRSSHSQYWVESSRDLLQCLDELATLWENKPRGPRAGQGAQPSRR